MAQSTITTKTQRARSYRQSIDAAQIDTRIRQGSRITAEHIELRGANLDSENYPAKESGNWKDVHYQRNKSSDMLVRKSLNDDKFIFSQHGNRVTSFSNLQAYDLALSILKNMNAVTTKVDFVKGHKYIRWTVRTRQGVKALARRMRRRNE